MVELGESLPKLSKCGPDCAEIDHNLAQLLTAVCRTLAKFGPDRPTCVARQPMSAHRPNVGSQAEIKREGETYGLEVVARPSALCHECVVLVASAAVPGYARTEELVRVYGRGVRILWSSASKKMQRGRCPREGMACTSRVDHVGLYCVCWYSGSCVCAAPMIKVRGAAVDGVTPKVMYPIFSGMAYISARYEALTPKLAAVPRVLSEITKVQDGIWTVRSNLCTHRMRGDKRVSALSTVPLDLPALPRFRVASDRAQHRRNSTENRGDTPVVQRRGSRVTRTSVGALVTTPPPSSHSRALAIKLTLCEALAPSERGFRRAASFGL